MSKKTKWLIHHNLPCIALLLWGSACCLGCALCGESTGDSIDSDNENGKKKT